MTYWNTMFKEWQEMQQQFMDNLPMKLPGIDYPQRSMNPWELPHLHTFMSWGQSAVKQSMELQTHWLEQWVGQMGTNIATSSTDRSDMISRIQESMDSWSDNQSELWEYWFKMVEETAGSMENPAPLYENISSWKSTVKESLTVQTECLERWSPENWSKEINIEELSPQELLNLSINIQETMNGWLELQGELWHQWFDFLRLNEITNTPSKPRPTQSETTKKRAKKKARSATTKPERNASASSRKEITRDNLELISGIGPALAKKLYTQGIINFQQIAKLTEKEIDKLEQTVIKFPGRIRREKWVSQARKFLKEAGRT